jgi:Zn-dependent protease with chaperone function
MSNPSGWEWDEKQLDFTLAHELSHAVHHHPMHSVEQPALLLAAYIPMFFLAKRTIALNSGTAILIPGFSLVAAALLGARVTPWLRRLHETQADATALALGPRFREGAILHFQKCLEDNLVHRARRGDDKYDRQGNNTLDHDHPLLTDRLAYATAYQYDTETNSTASLEKN